MPLLALFGSFSESNPIFFIVIRIRCYFRPGPAGVVLHLVGLVVTGFFTWVGALILFAGLGSCLLITGFGIAFVHGWTLFLLPDKYDGKLRGGLDFEQGIKMYRSLGIICKIHSELARDWVTTCMHHFYLIVCCSMGVWVLIKMFVDKAGITIFLFVGSLIGVGVVSFLEWFAVNFVSKAATGSNEFLHRMHKYNEKSKDRKKILAALLPNSINLEMIGSVETMRNGIQKKYFLSFVARVTDCTIRLLLANSKIDILLN